MNIVYNTDHERSADDGLLSVQRDDVITECCLDFSVRRDNISEVTDMPEQTAPVVTQFHKYMCTVDISTSAVSIQPHPIKRTITRIRLINACDNVDCKMYGYIS